MASNGLFAAWPVLGGEVPAALGLELGEDGAVAGAVAAGALFPAAIGAMAVAGGMHFVQIVDVDVVVIVETVDVVCTIACPWLVIVVVTGHVVRVV